MALVDDEDCAAGAALLAAAGGTWSRDRLRKAGKSDCAAAGERDADGTARLARGVAEAEAEADAGERIEAGEAAEAVGVLAKKAPPLGDGVSGAKKSCRRAG